MPSAPTAHADLPGAPAVRDGRVQEGGCDDGAIADLEVRRVALATFLRPGEETETGRPRLEPCLAYAIRHASGVLLVDTGMGSDPDVDAHYRPCRTPLAEALRAVGSGAHEVTEVVNCHLHLGHCGGNPSLAGRPVFAQRADVPAHRAAVGGAHVGAAAPGWMARLEQLDPVRVVFAHDHAVWLP